VVLLTKRGELSTKPSKKDKNLDFWLKCWLETGDAPMKKLCLLLLVIMFSQTACDSGKASSLQAKVKKARKLLVYSHPSGFKHGSIPTGKEAFQKMGKDSGAFEVTLNDDATFFTKKNLKQFDAILFNNCTHVQKAFKDKKNREAFLDFIKNGGGFIAIHAATDGGGKGWPEYTAMVNGNFNGHPWGSRGTWGIKNEDPKHPLLEAFKGKGFKIKDELYKYKSYDRKKCRVLLSIDTTISPKGKAQRPDNDHAVVWVSEYDKGRVFISSLGHNNEIFKHPQILDMWLKGIKFALGDLKIETKSLPQPK
jgi:type 1 glutamine amidotransferase